MVKDGKIPRQQTTEQVVLPPVAMDGPKEAQEAEAAVEKAVAVSESSEAQAPARRENMGRVPESGKTSSGKAGDRSVTGTGEVAGASPSDAGQEVASLPAPPFTSQTLPMPTEEGGLAAYLQKIREFPILSPAEEYMLAKRWREHADTEAAHKLVTSHLRLVAKIAMGYRGYGLPISEIISEGNVGLMQAVKRFEPDKGFRLATYAMWWIKAAIQEYILRSWSLVKMGTTASQKKLFFNLRKLKGQIKALDEGDMKPEQVKAIAERLGVSEEDVISMNRRLAGDASLNAPLKADGDSATEWQDWLVDEDENQEEKLAEREEYELRLQMLRRAMDRLNDRERRIFEARRLQEPPLTLEELSREFGVSRERIRQIEVRAFEKVQKAMREMAAEQLGERPGE